MTLNLQSFDNLSGTLFEHNKMTTKLFRMINRLNINLSSFFILLTILSTHPCMLHPPNESVLATGLSCNKPCQFPNSLNSRYHKTLISGSNNYDHLFLLRHFFFTIQLPTAVSFRDHSSKIEPRRNY